VSTSKVAAAPPGFVEPTFGQRLAGAILDGLVVLPLALITGSVAGRVTAVALVALYQIGLTARSGQTLGKMVMHTHVVDRQTGRTPSLTQAVIRWLTVLAGAVVAIAIPAFKPLAFVYDVVVLAPILSQPLHRGLHDRAASTVVTATQFLTSD
jgi:uncharacterized RDD family membrane protein YckC